MGQINFSSCIVKLLFFPNKYSFTLQKVWLTSKNGLSISSFIGSEPFFGLELMFFRGESRKGQKWRDHHSGRILEYWSRPRLMGDFDCSRSKVCRSLRKKSLRLLIGFLTGHCAVKGHLYKTWGCRWCILQIISGWRGISKTPANELRC